MDGPCLTLAGPGSGKTTVLTERIISLIRAGVSPESILVITFTKEAAKEMQTRFHNKMNDSNVNVVFGTFHSIFYRILKSSKKYKSYNLVYGNRKLAIIKDCLNVLKMDYEGKDEIVEIEKQISMYMNTGNDTEAKEDCFLNRDELLKLLSVYENRKEASKLLDFDDMLVKTKMLLEKEEGILKKWQNTFKYFLVDELQDINTVQFDVIKLLLNNHPCGSQNIFGVGDDDQSIYGFRGANPKFMLDFPKYFKNTKVIVLDKNYRSARTIVEKSKALIEKNTQRYKKDYIANSNADGKLEILSFKSNYEEVKYIVNLLNDELNNKIFINTAILYRNRSRAQLLTSLLRTKRIDFYIDENVYSIKNSDICRDIVSYFRLIDEHYQREDIIRIMNKPFRGLERGGLDDKRVTLHKWLDFYPKSSVSFSRIERLINNIDFMKGLTPFSCINFIRKGIGYDDYLKSLSKYKGVEVSEYIEIINEIQALAMDFDSVRSFVKEMETPDIEQNIKREDESISLCTFHGSKGLEFDRVFILDANEGITPSKNATDNMALEEERRMFYVAMTRAKNELYICFSDKLNDDLSKSSRFITELL